MVAVVTYSKARDVIALMVLFFAIAAVSTQAAGQSLSQQIAVCGNDGDQHDLPLVSEACDAVLESGQLSESEQATAYFNRGRLLYAAGQYDLAIDDFETALSLDPASEETRGRKALAFVAIGRVRQAQRDLLDLIADAESDHDEVFMKYIRELAASSGPHRHGLLARRLIEIVEPIQEGNTEMLETVAVAYAADRKFDIAVRTQYQALKLAEREGVVDLSGYRARFELYKSKRALVCPDMTVCWPTP